MYHVSVGSDTYGRVKKLGATSIVTRFGMVSGLPVFPLESFYLIRLGHLTSKGIPFIAQVHSRLIEGIPLARLDLLSVVMAYGRGLLGAIVLGGFISSFMLFMMWMTGEQFDHVQVIIAKCAGACLGLGTIASLGTYLVPFQMTSRERNIRRSCGMILGISADPARVRVDFAKSIESFLSETKADPGIPGLFHELALTRVRIALGSPPVALEHHTDDLLKRIEIQESNSV